MQSAIRSNQKVRLCSSNRKQNLHASSTASPPPFPKFRPLTNPFIAKTLVRSRSLNFDPFALMNANELLRARSFASICSAVQIPEIRKDRLSINLSPLFRRYREAPPSRIPQNIIEHCTSESPACGRI